MQNYYTIKTLRYESHGYTLLIFLRLIFVWLALLSVFLYEGTCVTGYGDCVQLLLCNTWRTYFERKICWNTWQSNDVFYVTMVRGLLIKWVPDYWTGGFKFYQRHAGSTIVLPVSGYINRYVNMKSGYYSKARLSLTMI